LSESLFYAIVHSDGKILLAFSQGNQSDAYLWFGIHNYIITAALY